MFYIFLLVFLAVGWIMNLSHLCTSDFSATLGLSIARVFGLFIFPLGTILGYFF